MRAFLIFVMGLLASAGCFAQKETLRYNLSVGKSYVLGVTTQSDVKWLLPGMEEDKGMNMNMNVNMNIDYVYTVKDKTADYYLIEVTLGKMEMENGLPQGRMTFSSESGATDITSAILAVMKESSFSLKMGFRGEVLEITGMEEFLDSALEKAPTLSQEHKNQAKEQFSKNIGTDMLKSMEWTTAVFPENPVSKGDKWSITTEMNNNGVPVKVTTTYEYLGREGDSWVVSGKSDFGMPEDSDYTDVKGSSVKYNVQGDITVAVKYDSSTGWISDGAMKQNSKSKISSKEGQGGAENKTVAMKMSSDIIMKGSIK